MSDDSVFIGIVCLGVGYLLRCIHVFLSDFLNDFYDEKHLSEIENHLKVIDSEIAAIIERIEKTR